jgi:hypothetical protein
MRDLYKRTRVVLEMEIRESIPKLTLLSKLLKKRRSCKDMVMSLMENSESVRRKSKHWPTLLTI